LTIELTPAQGAAIAAVLLGDNLFSALRSDLSIASSKDTLHDSEHLPQAILASGFQPVLGLVFKRAWNLPASSAPRGGPAKPFPFTLPNQFRCQTSKAPRFKSGKPGPEAVETCPHMPREDLAKRASLLLD